MLIDHADGDSLATIVTHGVTDYVVDLEIPDNTGYPAESVWVIGASDDGTCLVVCETSGGNPVRGSTWEVPFDLIVKLTVL